MPTINCSGMPMRNSINGIPPAWYYHTVRVCCNMLTKCPLLPLATLDDDFRASQRLYSAAESFDHVKQTVLIGGNE